MEIIKQINDLSIEKWYFIYLDRCIILNEYSVLQRQNEKDLNYEVVKKYSKSDKKNNNILENDIPFDDNLKKEIINQFISTIKVIKWNEKD